MPMLRAWARPVSRSFVAAILLALSFGGSVVAAPIFSDGFESGDTSAWAITEDDAGTTASLAVTAAAAIGPGAVACGGSPCGLAVTVADGSDQAWVADQSPSAATEYFASFRFDPNSVTGTFNHVILRGDHVDTPPSSPSFNVTLVRNGSGEYRFDIGVADDTPAYSGNQAIAPMTDGPMLVEVHWAAATGPGANNGFVTIAVDGIGVASLFNVDNDTRRVEAVRFGAVRDGANNNATGTYYLDDFQSFDEPPADLEIEKTGIESPPGTVVYTVSVTNNGPGEATGIVVTDQLPAELSYVSDDCGGSNAVPPWTWNIALISAGGASTCHITLTVLESGEVENTAAVDGDQFDPEEENNQSEPATLVVTAVPPLIEVPTLAGGGALLLGGLLAGVALRKLRRRG
jgi:uncharacterized repeat protein (TIGR01451 family)